MTVVDLLLGALAIVAGAVAALAGFGIGSLLTPALAALVDARLAVALVAVPHAVATAARLWVLRHAIDRSVLLGFGLASAAGGLAGALLHTVLQSAVLGIVLGGLLVLAGVSEIARLGPRLRIGGRWATVAGVLSGVFGGLVGNQGGIRSAALMRFDLSRQQLIATATATALLVDAARLPVYAVTSGAGIVRHLDTVAVLTAGVLVGTFVGSRVLRRVPEPVFRRGLAIALIVLGIALVVAFAG